MKNIKSKISSTTETASKYRHLDKMSFKEILKSINKEDKTVPLAIEKSLREIEILANEIYSKMKTGGRLFYIGAGTSGRLGIVDASECPPTFGIEQGKVIGIIAGGDSAIRKAVEFAEDHEKQGWKDLQKYKITKKDIVVGIAASGTTPYVVAAISTVRKKNIATGCIVCNEKSPLYIAAEFPICIATGAEFVTGSTRMKAGTAQKLVLNMLTTSVMIKLGRVLDNKMVDMQLTNNKLVKRGKNMLMEKLKIDEKSAENLLKKHGGVRKAMNSITN